MKNTLLKRRGNGRAQNLLELLRILNQSDFDSSLPIANALLKYTDLQTAALADASAKGEIDDAQIMGFLETPLLPDSALPGLMASIANNAGSESARIISYIQNASRSESAAIRFNASFSLIEISGHLPPTIAMYYLKGLVLTNLNLPEYSTIRDAAADAIVSLCREKKKPKLSRGAYMFFNDHSSLFQKQIIELQSLPSALSEFRASRPSRASTSSKRAPSKYPYPERRTRQRTIRPLPRTKELRPGLKIPREHTF